MGHSSNIFFRYIFIVSDEFLIVDKWQLSWEPGGEAYGIRLVLPPFFRQSQRLNPSGWPFSLSSSGSTLWLTTLPRLVRRPPCGRAINELIIILANQSVAQRVITALIVIGACAWSAEIITLKPKQHQDFQIDNGPITRLIFGLTTVASQNSGANSARRLRAFDARLDDLRQSRCHADEAQVALQKIGERILIADAKMSLVKPANLKGVRFKALKKIRAELQCKPDNLLERHTSYLQFACSLVPVRAYVNFKVSKFEPD
jgi:DNA-binding Xre family transcriptional regulator